MLGTRSTIRGILKGTYSSFHGECFLIIFYNYQFKFSSRGWLFLVFLWRELIFLHLHCHFLQGCNCINGNNKNWCHAQLLNIGLLHRTLSVLGIDYLRSLIALLYHFISFFSLLIHMHLQFLFIYICAFRINNFLLWD